MKEYLELLGNVFQENGLEISDQQLHQFDQYYEMLIEKNKVMNLTAITEPDEVMVKHFFDSAILLKYVDIPIGAKFLDLGTGAGFPGIPLKIMRPDLKITLADSLNKRILFLQDVIEALGLTQIEAIHGRAEELSRNKMYREKYDFVVSRAVANLSTLSEYCIPFVKVGGNFISYKAAGAREEIDSSSHALKELTSSVTDTYSFDLPMDAGERNLIVIKKEKPTGKKYPRKAGTPSKEPL